MSSAFSSWEERPEKLLRRSGSIEPRAGHPTAKWIEEQSRLADSTPVTKELDQFGVPKPSTSSSRFSKLQREDEEEPIGMLLGPSKQFRSRKDSHSSIGSSVLPPPLLGPGARYAANGGSYPSRSGGSKIGRTVYPASNHSGAAQSLRQLPIQQPPRLTSSRPSAFDLDEWLKGSQTASPPPPSVFPASPSMQMISTHRAGRNTTFSEAGSRRGNRYNAPSISGLSAGVLSAGPESPRSRRRASASTSKRSFANLDPNHPAFAASQELGMDAESRHIDTIEEWRAKAEPLSLDSQLTRTAGSRSRRGSLKANDRPLAEDVAPPLPSVPAVYADSVASTARRRKRKSPAPPPLPSSASVAFSDIGKTPPALRDLFLQAGVGSQQDTPARTFVRWLAKENLKPAILPLILLLSILVRWTVSRGDWSGRGAAPLLGDFEAQRHWIELTLHLPTSQWYFYDLQYWGLDYPPLTAWISLACGRVAQLFPSIRPGFAFESSRGNEDVLTVLFMRSSVLVCELLIYVPAVAVFLLRRLEGRGRRTQAVALLSVMMQPALILVDHGHFQYNSVMLGFAAACFTLLYTTLPNPDHTAPSTANGSAAPTARTRAVTDLSRRLSYGYVVAAVFFCLSLSFKQMALYYAPAVFAVMLGRCIGLAQIDVERGLTLFIGLGLAVVTTFGIVFAPWLTSLTQIGQVVHRIFPLARGLFEDKVSNVWCFLSVLPIPQRYKLKNLLDVSSLARLSLATTLVAILPACWLLFWAASQTAKMEMMVGQDLVVQRPRRDSIVSSSSVAKSTADRRKNRHRSTSVAGSIAGMGAMSEIESLLAGSSSKARKPAVDLANEAPRPVASTLPSPAAQMLPYGLVSVSCAFFLFGFQTHEKSILLPLLPMTLLIGAKGDTWAGTTTASKDWAWAVWFNNIATFSLFPLLSRDGQGLQYVVLTFAWNWLIGNFTIPVSPSSILSSLLSSVASVSAPTHAAVATLSYAAIAALHILQLLLPRVAPALHAASTARYPDLYPVLNVLLTTPCFMLVYIWALKRQVEVAFSNGFAFQSRKLKTV